MFLYSIVSIGVAIFLLLSLIATPTRLVPKSNPINLELSSNLYLSSIFEFIEKLNELNTENVEPLTSIAETKLKFRKDEIKSENIREKILKNSPSDNEDFFVVPKVVE